MQVETLDDDARSQRARAFLLGEEARHNLLLGIMADRDTYPEFHMWWVEEEGEPLLVAAMTPPFNVVVSRPAREEAIIELARALAIGAIALPGVSGAVPEVDLFARAWAEASGGDAVVHMSERIFRLESVRDVPAPPGGMRRATGADRELVLNWVGAFRREALPGKEEDPEMTERMVDARLGGERRGYFLWENGEPVCLVGYGGYTPNGARIGPVYTPRPHRRRGYAAALTAAVSAWLLGEGRRFCFLYTDRANRTSNAIYRRIGYEPVCDSVRYRFELP